MANQQLFRVDRPILLAGKRLQPGDVIDLAPLRLPAGRAQQLVDQRRGELLSNADEVQVPDTADEVITNWALRDAPLDPALGDTPDMDVDDGLSEPLTPEVQIGVWRSMTKPQLLDEVKMRGLSVRGNKTQLVDRLVEALG
jgi:hypothetical protein